MGGLEETTKSLKKNSLLINLALGLLLLANLLNMLAFSTPAWGRIFVTSGGGFYGMGLWRICFTGSTDLCTDTTGWPQDWYAAAQFFAIVGFVGITGGLVLLLLYMCAKSWKGNPSLLFWTAVFILVTAILYLIGIIIFGAEFYLRYGSTLVGLGRLGGLSWSFAVAVVADTIAVIVGILLLCQSRKTKSTSPNKGNAFKPSNKPHNKDQSPQEKKKSVSYASKNQNANQKASSKPPPVVTKTTNDHPPAKENERQRKTSTNVQPNNNNNTGAVPSVQPVPPITNNEQSKSTVANQDQTKQQQRSPRRYSHPAGKPVGPYKLQPRKSVGRQPAATGNTNACIEIKTSTGNTKASLEKKTSTENTKPSPEKKAGSQGKGQGH